jgi:hypothetical protein
MVQPYLRSVEQYGERSLVFFDGEPSHAIRKHPALTGEAGLDRAVEATSDEWAFARKVLEASRFETLYARVDVARDDQGAPVLMELELVEPTLFLTHAPPAAARLADAIVRRL